MKFLNIATFLTALTFCGVASATTSFPAKATTTYYGVDDNNKKCTVNIYTDDQGQPIALKGKIEGTNGFFAQGYNLDKIVTEVAGGIKVFGLTYLGVEYIRHNAILTGGDAAGDKDSAMSVKASNYIEVFDETENFSCSGLHRG